jgi:hypothetical protein
MPVAMLDEGKRQGQAVAVEMPTSLANASGRRPGGRHASLGVGWTSVAIQRVAQNECRSAVAAAYRR